MTDTTDQAHEEAFMHDAVASVLPAFRELPEALDLLRRLNLIGGAIDSRNWASTIQDLRTLADQAHTLLLRIAPLRTERVRFVPIPDPTHNDPKED